MTPRGIREAGILAAVATTVMLAAVPAFGRAHTFHAALAQVEYIATERRVEVALRVFVDDLESALSRRAGKTVRLDVTASFDALTLAYVRGTLAIESDTGAPLELRWVGKESSTDTVWIYVEATCPGGLDRGRIGCAVFFELFDDQVNTVNVKEGHRRATLTFVSGDGARDIVLPLADERRRLDGKGGGAA